MALVLATSLLVKLTRATTAATATDFKFNMILFLSFLDYDFGFGFGIYVVVWCFPKKKDLLLIGTSNCEKGCQITFFFVLFCFVLGFFCVVVVVVVVVAYLLLGAFRTTQRSWKKKEKHHCTQKVEGPAHQVPFP